MANITFKSLRNLGLVFLVSCMETSSALAADDIFNGENIFTELPQVLTASRMPHSYLDVPAAVSVIDRDMIEASGFTEVADLFRLVSGFQVGHRTGVDTGVTYHGMSDSSSTRLQVLIDGRPVYLPATGGVQWFDLSLSMEDIKRIEVTRGPNGVSYGANAFLSTINIITFAGDELENASTKVQAGARDYKSLFARHAGKSADLSYRISAEHSEDDGYEDVPYRNKTIVMKDDKRIDTMNLRMDYRVGINDFISFQTGLTDNALGDGRGGDLTQPYHYIETSRNFQQFTWRKNLSSDDELRMQIYRIAYDTTDHYKSALISEIFGITPAEVEALLGVPDQRAVVDRDIRSERLNLEVQQTVRLTDTLRLAYGVDLRQDEVTSAGYFNTKETQHNNMYRGFANMESQLDPVVVNLGMMYEVSGYADNILSPRLAVNYHLSNEHTVRMVYSEAYRAPSFFEKYADHGGRFELDGSLADQLWTGNENLEHERIRSIEMGLAGQLQGGGVHYDIRAFREEITNIIATPVDRNYPDRYNDPFYCGLFEGFCRSDVFVNDGEAHMKGVETQVSYNRKEDIFSLGFSAVDASGKVLDDIHWLDGRPDSYDTMEGATPEYTLSVLYSRKMAGNWKSSIATYHVTDMEFLEGGEPTGGYTTTNVGVSRSFRGKGVEGRATLAIRNIFDYEYYDYYVNSQQQRDLYVQLGISF